MNGIAKVLGRIIAVLISSGIIDGEQAEWIMEPLNEQLEPETKEKTTNDTDK